MRIARCFAVALTVCTMSLLASNVRAAQAPLTLTDNPNTPNATTITYDPTNGFFQVSGSGINQTSIDLRSKSGIFNIAAPGGDGSSGIRPKGEAPFTGLFDVSTPNKLFVLATPPGYCCLNYASADGLNIPAGTSDLLAFLLADLTIDGSLNPSGALSDAPGGGPYLYGCPEPSGLTLLAIGLGGLMGMRRRSSFRLRSCR